MPAAPCHRRIPESCLGSLPLAALQDLTSSVSWLVILSVLALCGRKMFALWRLGIYPYKGRPQDHKHGSVKPICVAVYCKACKYHLMFCGSTTSCSAEDRPTCPNHVASGQSLPQKLIRDGIAGASLATASDQCNALIVVVPGCDLTTAWEQGPTPLAQPGCHLSRARHAVVAIAMPAIGTCMHARCPDILLSGVVWCGHGGSLAPYSIGQGAICINLPQGCGWGPVLLTSLPHPVCDYLHNMWSTCLVCIIFVSAFFMRDVCSASIMKACKSGKPELLHQLDIHCVPPWWTALCSDGFTISMCNQLLQIIKPSQQA
jgi:hypothetical protein